MGIFEGCLLACDIDDTLMASGYINPENIKKIAFFEKEGGKFVLSTGRGVAALNNVLEQMPDISIAVVANGCIIYNYQNGEILYEEEIKKEEYRFAKYVGGLGFDVGAEVHIGNSAYTLKRNAPATLHQEYEKFISPDVAFDDISEHKWNKVIFLFTSAEDRNKVKELLDKEDTDCIFINTSVVINGEIQNYLEQIPRGVSKASALKKLCEILDIKNGKLFAIGDYYNDIEMLKLADISATLCNSPDDVKKYANYITCACKDGAVADFIDYLTSKFNA